MKLYYVSIDTYGLYIFSAGDTNGARYHLEDVFPQYDFELKDIQELKSLTSFYIERNWITLVPSRSRQ